MYLSLLLHMYQPPTQTEEMLKTIVNESYRKIIDGLKNNPKGKITLNINAALTELLVQYKYNDIINDITSPLTKTTSPGENFSSS